MDLVKSDEPTSTTTNCTEKDNEDKETTSKLENESNNEDSNECTIPKSSPNKCVKRSYLEVSSSSTSTSLNGNSDLNKYKNFLLKPLETKRFKLSETLDKVKQFLPSLKESTDKLLNECKENPDLVNIENVNEDDEQVIEMNLAFVSDSSDGDEDGDEEEKSSSESEEDDDDDDGDDSENDDEDESGGDKVLDIEKLAEYSHNKNELDKLLIHKNKNKKSKKPLIKIISEDSNTNTEDVKCLNIDENNSNDDSQNKCEIVESSNEENK